MVANEAASHAAASSATFELRGARIAVAIVDIHTSIAINRSGCGHPRHSLESIGEDDSCVHPSHQTAPVRQTERGTAVAAVQFLELLHALDPSTGNLTTAQLTKDVTSRAAPAKPEHLRSRTPARPEAIPAPEAASLAESAGAPAKPESQGDRPRRMSAEQHSAHTTEMDQHSAHITEMMLLHHMRQRSTSGELRAARYTPAWSPGPGKSRAKTLDCFEGKFPYSR